MSHASSSESGLTVSSLLTVSVLWNHKVGAICIKCTSGVGSAASLHRQTAGQEAFHPWPVPRPRGRVERINRPEPAAELEGVRRSVLSSQPAGIALNDIQMVKELVEKLGVKTLKDLIDVFGG